MDRVGKTMWRRRKNKGLRSGDVGEVVETQTRSVNWSKLESNDLLESARDVQLERGRSDLNFTKPEMGQVYTVFCERSPRTPRTQEQALNILRTMRKEFNIFHELASKSGWGWDFDNHVPIPPSLQIFKELCQNEARYKYFDTKKYPWYSQMLTMCGGRLANGTTRRNLFSGQNSIARSGTDSSDPGNEEPLHNEVEETIQQPYPAQSPDTTYTRQSSQRDASMSSGSGKRKSTEDDGDGLTRRQKIQKRLSARGKGFERMAEAGEKMMAINEKLAGLAERAIDLKESHNTKEDRAIDRLTSFGFPAAITNAIMKELKISVNVTYFLKASNDQIFEWMFQNLPSHLMKQYFSNCPPSQDVNPQQGGPYFNPSFMEAFQHFNVNPRPPSQ